MEKEKIPKKFKKEENQEVSRDTQKNKKTGNSRKKVLKNALYEKKIIKEENLEGSGTQIKIKKKENSEEKSIE